MNWQLSSISGIIKSFLSYSHNKEEPYFKNTCPTNNFPVKIHQVESKGYYLFPILIKL